MYVERQDQYIIRLYITQIQESDAGQYSCEADVNEGTLTEETRMFLYGWNQSILFVFFILLSSLLLFLLILARLWLLLVMLPFA